VATRLTESALVDPGGDPPNATTPPHPESPKKELQITRTAISGTAFEFEFWQELDDRGAMVRRPDVGCISIPYIYHFSRADISEMGLSQGKVQQSGELLIAVPGADATEGPAECRSARMQNCGSCFFDLRLAQGEVTGEDCPPRVKRGNSPMRVELHR